VFTRIRHLLGYILSIYTPNGKLIPPKKEEMAMAKKVLPFSEMRVRTAKPADKPYKLYDGDGLFLFDHFTRR
jgi:hypothetical protein